MENLKEKAEKGDIRDESPKNASFYWIFNPDGSMIDHSKVDYQLFLESSYRAETSGGLYLGE